MTTDENRAIIALSFDFCFRNWVFELQQRLEKSNHKVENFSLTTMHKLFREGYPTLDASNALLDFYGPSGII